MKKSLKLIVILLMLFPVYVFANIGAPYLPEWDALVSNINGADYHNYDNNKIGTIPYDTQIRVTNESQGYAQIRYNDDFVYVKINDLIPLKDEFSITEEQVLKLKKPVQLRVFNPESEDGIKIYKGPSRAYEEIGVIPIDGIATASYYLEDYDKGMVTWYYVDYNDLKGWVCAWKGGLGSKVDNPETTIFSSNKNVYLVSDTYMYLDDKSYMPQLGIKKGAAENIIPYGTKTTELIEVYDDCSWYGKFGGYIKYNGNWYVSGTGAAVEANKKYIVTTERTLYEQADENSKKIMNIPAGTQVQSIYYEGIYLTNSFWIMVEYNGEKGWIFNQINDILYWDEYEQFHKDAKNYIVNETIDLHKYLNSDSEVIATISKDEIIKAVLNGEYNSSGKYYHVEYKNKLGYIFVPNNSDVISLQEDEETNPTLPEEDKNSNLENEEQKPIEDNKTENNIKESKKISSIELLYICIGVAVVLSITMIVTIKLINKKKNRNNILDNSLENKQNVELNNSDNNITYVEQYPQEQSDIINTEIKEETNKTDDIINDVSDNKL